MYTRLLLILGDQLFPEHAPLRPDAHSLFFMAEDKGLCTHYTYHKHKLVLFLSAMRSHADQLRTAFPLEYYTLNTQNQAWSFEEKLEKTLNEYKGIESLCTYEIEDRFFAERIAAFCQKHKLKLETVQSQGFLNSRESFANYLDKHKKPFMQSFYKQQRQQRNVLLDKQGEALHGKWSFDEENRKKLPPGLHIPTQPSSGLTAHDKSVIELVNQLFPDHPGDLEHFNFSTTRRSALARLNLFLKERFENFGPYEDAIDKNHNYLFHSVLSPYINMGLITAEEVLKKALEYFEENETHYPSVEGFVRQLMGWREFMRGIYHHFELEKNHFNQNRKMKACWYEGNTGIPPLDDAINKARKHAYTHHIERLMILGNLMLSCGLHPKEVYKWFMEMYADSADWVMAPNVYGMSQFAEGGIFATKPYISGSNYILKMSNYSKGNWCDIVDGLYWRFIAVHEETFAKNPRMGMMLATLNRMNPDKKKHIFDAAENWIDRVSYT